MKSDKLDHAPLVEEWLKEPIWLPEGDTARVGQLVHLTSQQRGWLRPLIARRSHTMFSATKFVAAGVIVAAFGGFLLSTGTLLPRADDPVPAAVSASPSATVSDGQTTPVPVDDADALVMSASNGQQVAGWFETGRVSATNEDGSGYSEMRQLQAVGERLVAIGQTLAPDEGPTSDVIYHSLDGITWVPANVPGERPEITDLAATADGLLAAGAARVDGKREARLWSSPDGIEWTEVDAPGLKRIDQIVSAEVPLAVRGGKELWANHDGNEWTLATDLVNMQTLRGPGGFLAWQFDTVATMIQSADLASGWTEVNLPSKLSKGGASLVRDMQVFALDDQWVMVPHVLTSPDSIYTSRDGIEWTEAPRPPGILAGAVRWIADVDGQAQAHGAVEGDEGDELGIWTFVPGQSVAAAETMAGTDEFIDTPVPFGNGYAATGLKMGRGTQLTTWWREASTPE